MTLKELQKSALTTNLDDMPIEVLDPVHSSQYYSVKMYDPIADLSDVIDHYWVMRWSLPEGRSFTAEIIPSPYINVTFMSGGAKITGVTTGKYTYEVVGSGSIVGAKFHPGGYRALTSKSASEITDKVIPATDSFSAATDNLNEKVLNVDDDIQAIAFLEKILLPLSRPVDENFVLVNKIIDDIKTSKFDTVSAISSQYGVNERRLQELFQDYVGVGVKWILLRYRLLAATQIAMSEEKVNWTDCAARLGYSDQSHFINDFKRVIGKTPGQYLKSIS